MIANLLTRTEYSFLYSLCFLEKTVNHAKELGYDALGMADLGNMHAAYKFYNLCKKAEIKPIIGLEINLCDNDIDYPVLLYAMDTFGYQNLMKISTIQKIKKSVEFSDLDNNKIGVLAILLPTIRNLGNNNVIKKLKDTFSYFYVGITPSILNEDYASLHNNFMFNGIEEVAIHETCYFNDDDFEKFIVLNAIKENKLAKDIQIQEDLHFFTPDEYKIAFNNYPYLLENNAFINNLCNVELPKPTMQLPLYQEGLDTENYLKALCYKGLQKRLGDVPYEYLERLDKELKIINQMGFNDYFLIVWDYVKFAKKNDILVGPGRGSAAGSLVSYALGITEIDPIKYDLLFERFLNPERITMPDIDVDFPDTEREAVMRYVASRYGKDHVAHIVTFGTFAARSAIRDVAKALSLSDVRLQEILKHCQEDKKSLKQMFDGDEDFQKLYYDYADIKKVIDIALAIEGLPRNISTHAAGLIITKYQMVQYTPLDDGLNDIYQTQYEASDLEQLGLLKMDFLGLRNLTIIKNTVDMVKKDYPLFKLPQSFDDRDTLQLLSNGDTTGIFQLESSGMKQTLRQVQVNNFEDISKVLALYRPGPQDEIPTYVARKSGKEQIQYLHRDLVDILKPTYGVILYQEQIMQIAVKFAGYTLGEADVLRRAVSKKKRDVLEKERSKFVRSSVNNGYDEETALKIYDYIYKFADYGFNKSHSVSYAVIAYQTAFLKCHYPNYYYSVLLNSVIGTNSLVDDYVNEARKRRIKILSPDVNESTNEFKVFGGKILMPLTQIDGIGKAYYEEFNNIRSSKFTSFEDFIERIGNSLPASIIEKLIYAGALDSFGLTKKAMIDNYGLVVNRKKYAFVKNVVNVEYENDEFGYGFLLNKEKEVLGVNVKYSFMYQYEGYYRHRQATHISDVKPGFVNILGAVTKIREVSTKSGKPMMFAEIKDETGTISITVFNSHYDEFKNVQLGMVLLINGRVENRNNELQLVLEQFKQI